MKVIDITKYKNVYATGDIHGNIRQLSFAINEVKKMKDSFVIVCGDIGFGFTSPINISNDLDRICHKLGKNGNAIGVFRGNHDDPSWFHNTEQVNEICLQKGAKGIMRDEFMIIDDYTVLKTRYGNILCIGGARSIDKCVRIEGMSWWSGEMVDNLPENFFEELGDIKIDHVCSHTAPSVAYPLGSGGIMNDFAMYDETLFEECECERVKLSELWALLTENGHDIKYWLYGHFHAHHERLVDKTCFICLDMIRNNCDFHKFQKQ